MTRTRVPRPLSTLGLTMALGLALAFPALADDAVDAARQPDPTVARIMVQLDHAQKQFGKLTKSRTTSNRIKTLDRALHFLRSARGVATKREEPVFEALLSDIEPLLLRALNDKTRLYLSRTSYSKAIKSNEEALEVDDGNDDALGLRDLIIERTTIDYSDDDYVGSLVYDRIHTRRSRLIGLHGYGRPRHGSRSSVSARRGRTRFRVGNAGGVSFRSDDGDFRARFGTDQGSTDPGRAPPPTTRVGAAAGRLGTTGLGVFPPAQNRAGQRLEQGTGIRGAAAGRTGTMSFGVFPQVQNRAGRPVGHSSGVVRTPSPRTNAAARFNPGAVSH